MTRVRYEPTIPALEMDGHAGAGEYGRDPVCAALSILLFTLLDANDAATAHFADGYARISGGRKRDYALMARGARLLAENYPQYVGYEEIKNEK